MSSKGKWHEEKWGTNEEPVETPTERPHCARKRISDLEASKYKQALDEIEGLATNLRTRTDYHSEEEVNADIENILDIISKAKGGRK